VSVVRTAEERERLIALAHRHAAVEAAGDMEATMATLDDNPRYELLPTGIVFTGRDAARTYYEHFFSTFQPAAVGGELRAEYVSDEGVAQEYVITVRGPGGVKERFPIVSVLTFGETLLSGERVYGEDRLLRLLDEQPFLVVLDGLERILLAYARLDAAHLADDDLDERTANELVDAMGLPQEARETYLEKHRLRRAALPTPEARGWPRTLWS